MSSSLISALPRDDTALKIALMKCWEEQQQTEEQNEAILRFRGKRAARLRRQNNTTALTRVFPPEILSLIFFHARGDPISSTTCQHDLLRLGHVCSKWRSILLSIPQIWSYFTLVVKSHPQKQQDVKLLQFYINNARDLPFSLCISFPRIYPGHSSLTGQIFYMLQLHVPKVHTLRVECAPWAWVPWLSWFSSVNSLEISSIVMPPAPDVTPSFVQFTCLRRLELSGSPSLKGVLLPWTQITSLTLKSMAIDLCMSLLLQCPNLVEFHCPSSRRRIEGNVPIPQIPDDLVRLEHLEHLTWSYEPDPICNNFYHRLRFPALRTLRWHSLSYRRSLSATGELCALRSLVPNFPPTISQLYIFCAGSWPNDLTGLVLNQVKNLRIIHFLKCKYPMVVDALSLLNRKDPRGRDVSPLLDEIMIQDPDGPPADISTRGRLEAQLAACITSTICTRDPNKTKNFSLELVQTAGFTSKKMREAYISLKKNGYAFNVWIDTARVNSIQSVLDRERRIEQKKKEEIPKSCSMTQPIDDEDEGGWILQRR